MTSVNRISSGPTAELDLFSIGAALLRQKTMIVYVALAVMIGALAYAFLATPVYRVTSALRPVALNELDVLNRSGIYTLSPEEAVRRVGASLESYDTRLAYFRAFPELFKSFEDKGLSLEQRFEIFNKDSLKLRQPNLNEADSLSKPIEIELTYKGGSDGVAMLNGLIDYSVSLERKRIKDDTSVIIGNRLKELDTQIETTRVSYETLKNLQVASLKERDEVKRAQLRDELSARRVELKALRTNRVAELEEALVIARRLGIKRPSTPSSLTDLAGSNTGAGNVVRTEVNNQYIPLYFLGTDALEAESAALSQRRSDDFTDARIPAIAKELQLLEKNREVEALKQRQHEDLFLANIANLRAEQSRLKTMNLQLDDLKLVELDRKAVAPLAPIAPKKWLLAVAGLMGGLLLGMSIAFLRFFLTVGHREYLQRATVLENRGSGESIMMTQQRRLEEHAV